jgi:hypothetical protein
MAVHYIRTFHKLVVLLINRLVDRLLHVQPLLLMHHNHFH